MYLAYGFYKYTRSVFLPLIFSSFRHILYNIIINIWHLDILKRREDWVSQTARG